MSEKTVAANGIDICTEAFGDPADEPILLVMGASASMLLWEDDFCRRLADGGRYVIRYDNRDTGRSTSFAIESEPYHVGDMAADAVGVMDAYGLESAHVVGASMGGMIAQHVALDHPSRARTITVIMSTPDPSPIMAAMAGQEPGADTLPPPTPDVVAAAAKALDIDPSDDEAVLENRVAMFRILSGSAYPYDEDTRRALFRAEMDRASDFAKSANHGVAVGMTPPWRQRLGSIDVPTLVVHGTEDPILPYGHGEALAAEIPGATMLPMRGVGHELPEQQWDEVVSAILEHTSPR
jgi:pimeloyl-ACP methyl ester carboxylesterase